MCVRVLLRVRMGWDGMVWVGLGWVGLGLLVESNRCYYNKNRGSKKTEKEVYMAEDDSSMPVTVS